MLALPDGCVGVTSVTKAKVFAGAAWTISGSLSQKSSGTSMASWSTTIDQCRSGERHSTSPRTFSATRSRRGGPARLTFGRSAAQMRPVRTPSRILEHQTALLRAASAPDFARRPCGSSCLLRRHEYAVRLALAVACAARRSDCLALVARTRTALCLGPVMALDGEAWNARDRLVSVSERRARRRRRGRL